MSFREFTACAVRFCGRIMGMKKTFLVALLVATTSFAAESVFAQSAFDDPGSGGASAGDLVAVEKEIDGGDIALGSSSQIVVLLRNDDIKPINIGDMNLYPSSNVSAATAENQCAAEPLAPQAVCAVALSVKGLQSGKYRIEMLIRHEAKSRLLTVTVSGNVDASSNAAGERNSDLETMPSDLDFSTLENSRPQVRSVVFRNITSQAINVSDVLIQANDSSGFSVSHNCDTLESSQACYASVTWAPQQVGEATGVLIVKHDGPTGIASVLMEGEYDPDDSEEATIFPQAVPGKGLLVSSMSEINFGGDIEKESSITVSLVNAGDEIVTLKDISMASSENGLTIEDTGCHAGLILEPIEACPLTLTWSPVRIGPVLDDIRVAHDGARGVLILPVRGTASATVSKDSKAIVLGGDAFSAVPPINTSDLEGIDGEPGVSAPSQSQTGARIRRSKNLSDYQVGDVRGILDGYKITSLATNRAIVSGPGGSRVVFDGENTVIGGVPWSVSVKAGAVQFSHSDQDIILLFDRSLSFVNSNSGQSGSANNSSSSTVSSTSASQ